MSLNLISRYGKPISVRPLLNLRCGTVLACKDVGFVLQYISSEFDSAFRMPHVDGGADSPQVLRRVLPFPPKTTPSRYHSPMHLQVT